MPIPASVIGLESPPRTVPVERGQLVLFAHAIGEVDPIYTDVDSARAAGHPDLPVPPTFLFGLNLAGPESFQWLVDLGIDLRRVLHGEQRFTYRSIAHAGDDLVLAPRVSDHYTRRNGALEFLVRRTAVTRPDGRAVADLVDTMIVCHRRLDGPGARPALPTMRVDARLPDLTLPDLTLPEISRATLTLFAGGSGDHNPIHLDRDVARSAGLDDVFAQGMLSMAYLGRLLTDWLPQDRIRSFGARFVAVTPVHAVPTCRARVTSIEKVDGERLATLELAVELADGTVTVVGDAVVALPDTEATD